MTTPPRTLKDFLSRLSRLEGLSEWPALTQWGRLLDLTDLRRSLPEDAPLVAVLLGPTGVGKSTLFNHFLGRPASPTSAVRPCTRHAVGIAPPNVVDFFRRDPVLGNSRTAIEWVDPDSPASGLGHQALLDAPDFDSVIRDNRDMAELLLHRADRVILVLSPEKYADASVWDTLDLLRPLDNVAGCVFNKSEGRVSLEHCTELLHQSGFPAPLSVPRIAAPDDLTSLEPAARQALVSLLSPPEATGSVLAERRTSLERWQARYRSEFIEPWVASLHSTLTFVEDELARFSRELPNRIRSRLPLQLDEAFSRQLQERFLEKIQELDVLREPRRWISAPFRWLSGAFAFHRIPSPKGEPAQSTAQWLTRIHLDRYLEFALDLAGQLRGLVDRAATSTKPHLPWPDVPDPDPELATAALERVFGDLQKEMERESTRISEGLSAAGKLSFYGSQAVFQVLLLGILLKTGGGLSFGDLAAQGLVSPFVAKLFAHLVSSGETAAVQKRLETFLANRFEQEILPLASPVEDYVRSLREAIGTPRDWREAVSQWEAAGTRAA